MSSYVTIGGDTFDAVSRKTTGTGAQAGAIRAANPGVLEPIPAGVTLTVPDMPPPVVFPAPNTKSNELSLMLDGSRFRYWTELSISREYDTIDKIEFSAPFDTDNYSFVELFKPLTYKSAQVMIGNQALFTGTIVSVSPDFKSDSGTVTVGAYAKAGVLLDCCPPAAALPLEFKNMTLDVIAASVCAPFGVLSSFEGSPAARSVASGSNRIKPCSSSSQIWPSNETPTWDPMFWAILFSGRRPPQGRIWRS